MARRPNRDKLMPMTTIPIDTETRFQLGDAGEATVVFGRKGALVTGAFAQPGWVAEVSPRGLRGRPKRAKRFTVALRVADQQPHDGPEVWLEAARVGPDAWETVVREIDPDGRVDRVTCPAGTVEVEWDGTVIRTHRATAAPGWTATVASAPRSPEDQHLIVGFDRSGAVEGGEEWVVMTDFVPSESPAGRGHVEVEHVLPATVVG